MCAISGSLSAATVPLITAHTRDAGLGVRMVFGDPDSPYVRSRGAETGIDDALRAKVRSALVRCRPLAETDSVAVRRHATVLRNSLYRADDELLVNTHVYGVRAARASMLHLRSFGPESLASTYLDNFERVWAGASPLTSPRTGRWDVWDASGTSGRRFKRLPAHRGSLIVHRAT
jgi:hypothetical protein